MSIRGRGAEVIRYRWSEESKRREKAASASASLSRVGSGEADLLLYFIVSWEVACVKGETPCLVFESRLDDEHGTGGEERGWRGRKKEGDGWTGNISGDDFSSDRCAVCERVTRSGDGGKSTRNSDSSPGREYVSTPVFEAVARGHVGKVAQIWRGFARQLDVSAGWAGRKWERWENSLGCYDIRVTCLGPHPEMWHRVRGSSSLSSRTPCHVPARIDTRFPYRLYSSLLLYSQPPPTYTGQPATAARLPPASIPHSIQILPPLCKSPPRPREAGRTSVHSG